MHLSSLTLTNVRQFREETFHFRPGFNLLIGKNGAGKTTILRSVLLTLRGHQRFGRRPRMEDEDVRLRENDAEVKAVIQSSDRLPLTFKCRKTLWQPDQRSSPKSARPLVLLYSSNEATCSGMRVKQTKLSYGANDIDLRRSEEFVYEMEIQFEGLRSRTSSLRFGNSRSVRSFVGEMLSTFDRDFLNFYWRFEPFDCSLRPPEGKKMGTSLDAKTQKQVRAHAMRFFAEDWPLRRKMPYTWPDRTAVILTPEQEKLPPTRRGGGLPELRDIWQGIKLAPEALKALQYCHLEVKLTPRIMIRRKGGLIALSQLSDGEQRLFSMFVDIARQLSLANSDDPIGDHEAIVLIDEIDVHLHPLWQRRIVPALEELFPRCQFIATTHSPFVIQSLEPGKLISLDKRPDEVGEYSNQSIEDIAETVQGVDMPQRNHRAQVLSLAVEEYAQTLLNPRATKRDVKRADAKFRRAAEPYAPDPGLNALLKLEAMAAERFAKE